MPWVDGHYTTTVVLVGEVFHSEVTATVTMTDRGGLTQGETDMVVDAIADAFRAAYLGDVPMDLFTPTELTADLEPPPKIDPQAPTQEDA